MNDNFLISLRDFDGLGIPGTHMGTETTYFDMSDEQKVYLLPEKNLLDVWLAKLHKATSAARVLVFVHGYADNAWKVVERHHSIKNQLPSGITLVSFDWPAGNLDKPYETDKANAALSAPMLIRDCLKVLLDNKFTSNNIHLFAHSMGGFVTEAAFQDPKSIKINHVVMAAADVDQSNYVAGSTTLKNVLSKCTDLTAYWSSDDVALQGSRTFNKYIPLGLNGFPDPDTPASCTAVQCTTYYNKYAKYEGQPDDFSHVWYILYAPTPPLVNDFYADMNRTLSGGPAPTPPPTWPTRASGFVLRRPA